MSVGLVVVGDGRLPYLAQCLASLDETLLTPVTCRALIYDEPRAGGGAYVLAQRHGLELKVHAPRRGMAGAIQSAWHFALRHEWDYLLHIEEDFIFRPAIPVQQMAGILDDHPHLSQLVLKRQPWSAEEHAAGGIMEMHPELYTECSRLGRKGVAWVEHRRIFSLNPCLIPRRVVESGWPPGNEAEITAKLNADEGNRFAFWGHKADPPMVEHIGHARAYGWRL